MCGIAGALVYDLGSNRLESLIGAVKASSSRGEDAFGIVKWSPTGGFKSFRRQGLFREDWLTALENREQATPVIYIHTSRAEPTTEWQQKKTEIDIPPFLNGEIAVAHNGIISNDKELASCYGLERESPIDTAIIPGLIKKLGIWTALSVLQGGAALAVVDGAFQRLYLCRNFMPLVLAWEPGIVTFASERNFFEQANAPFRPYQFFDLPPYTCIELSDRGYRYPVRWGEQPAWDEHQEWCSYPALRW